MAKFKVIVWFISHINATCDRMREFVYEADRDIDAGLQFHAENGHDHTVHDIVQVPEETPCGPLTSTTSTSC